MRARLRFHNRIVTALLLLVLVGPALAQDPAKIDTLFERLKSADAGEASRIETEIMVLWEKSGSAAIDLLYRRGTDALDNGNPLAATEHFSAALDHDPAFTQARMQRAEALYALGQSGPALADIAEVLKVEERHFQAWSLLGTILEETGRTEQALAAYRRQAAIYPERADLKTYIDQLARQLEGQEL